MSDEIVTRRCGSATGSVRRSMLLTREKIAVLAPIPRASERAATPQTIGVARSARRARRRSCILVDYTRSLVQLVKHLVEPLFPAADHRPRAPVRRSTDAPPRGSPEAAA